MRKWVLGQSDLLFQVADLGQRVLGLPAHLRTLERCGSIPPVSLETVKLEHAGFEAVFEGGKSGGDHPSWTKPVATKPPNTKIERSRIRTRAAIVALATNATSLIQLVFVTCVYPLQLTLLVDIGS